MQFSHSQPMGGKRPSPEVWPRRKKVKYSISGPGSLKSSPGKGPYVFRLKKKGSYKKKEKEKK